MPANAISWLGRVRRRMREVRVQTAGSSSVACRRDRHVQCSFGQAPSDSCVTHEGREVTAPGLGGCKLYFVWPGICAPINYYTI
jgi:hypothetical protein